MASASAEPSAPRDARYRRPFFGSLCDFMSSGPIFPMVLEKENAIADLRKLMGATNPANAGVPGKLACWDGDALYAILAHPPTSSLQQRRDPAIAITAVLACKLDDRLRERIFVFPPDRTIALRAAWLVRQPASPALRHPMLLLCMGRCDPSSLRVLRA